MINVTGQPELGPGKPGVISSSLISKFKEDADVEMCGIAESEVPTHWRRHESSNGMLRVEHHGNIATASLPGPA